MKTALPIDKYLAINHGRYLREMIEIPRCKSSLYVTTHLEAADTGLPHYHESAHLSFILNGCVVDKRISTEDERTVCDLMFFRAGEVHQSIYCLFPSKNLNIELEPAFFQRNEVSECDLEKVLVKDGDAKFTLMRIYKEMQSYDSFSAASIEMLLLSLTTESETARPFPPWLKQVVEILNDHWNDDLSVMDIAAEVRVHPKTVSKHFSRYVGCTLGEYRRRLKVERSLSIIRSSKRSLTEIAQMCGFYDQSHFILAFKQLTGMLPRQFRRI